MCVGAPHKGEFFRHFSGSWLAAKAGLRLRESGYLNDGESMVYEFLAHFDLIAKYMYCQVAELSTGCRFFAHLPLREA